jgi:hypothetical protein
MDQHIVGFELLPNQTIIGIIRIPTPAKNPPRVKSQILEKGGVGILIIPIMV